MYDRVNMVHQVHGRGMHLVKNRSDLILGQKKKYIDILQRKEKIKRGKVQAELELQHCYYDLLSEAKWEFQFLKGT